MVWLQITLMFVGMWALLGIFLFQVFKYVRAKAEADAQGEGWDEGL